MIINGNYQTLMLVIPVSGFLNINRIRLYRSGDFSRDNEKIPAFLSASLME